MEISMPKIIFESGWLLESSIAELSKFALDEKAVNEISERLPDFQNAWDQNGYLLLKAAQEESGLFFKEKDIKGFLISGSLSSHSHPLILNVKYYLNSCETSPRPISEFVEMVFHELLHILLQDHVAVWPTPFTEKFPEHSFEMAVHLHLMALERRSHETLEKETSWLQNWYEKVGGEYQKAWNFISEKQNYENLLQELTTEFGKNQIPNQPLDPQSPSANL